MCLFVGAFSTCEGGGRRKNRSNLFVMVVHARLLRADCWLRSAHLDGKKAPASCLLNVTEVVRCQFTLLAAGFATHPSFLAGHLLLTSYPTAATATRVMSDMDIFCARCPTYIWRGGSIVWLREVLLKLDEAVITGGRLKNCRSRQKKLFSQLFNRGDDRHQDGCLW
jgi:hypothetical protein